MYLYVAGCCRVLSLRAVSPEQSCLFHSPRSQSTCSASPGIFSFSFLRSFRRKRLKNTQLCFPGFFLVVQQITLWVTVYIFSTGVSVNDLWLLFQAYPVCWRLRPTDERTNEIPASAYGAQAAGQVSQAYLDLYLVQSPCSQSYLGCWQRKESLFFMWGLLLPRQTVFRFSC